MHGLLMIDLVNVESATLAIFLFCFLTKNVYVNINELLKVKLSSKSIT